MVRTVSARDAKANIEDLLDSVHATKEPVVVEEDGKPYAVVISPEDYERFQQARLERAWAVIQRVQERNADKDPDEVLRDVTEIVEEVRRERYERSQRSNQSSR